MRAPAALLGAVLAAASLAACAGPPESIGRNETRGVPKGAAGLSDGQTDPPHVAVAWTEPAAVQVTTWGSGSCPTRPVSVELDAPDRVLVRVRRTEDAEACTDDLAPTTNTVDLPDGTDLTAPLQVAVGSGSGGPVRVTVTPPGQG